MLNLSNVIVAALEVDVLDRNEIAGGFVECAVDSAERAAWYVC